ncbi:MAG TPA: hypothetical protein DDZ80_00535 [Cyanobacteria bacterium UBA8803]|nr:hypothetical protein [Cyanobacteria bacterium UBA9273]HBL57101.1 hypothetical protein [Cyanobacteria bacterium UBA8803]
MVLLRGALIEYASDFLGPLPNVVIFQFNPTLTHNIQIPERPTGITSRESSQAGEVPVERINFTAHFTAADQLDAGNIIAQELGIGPQLAALEKMVYPSNFIGELLGEAIDKIGDAIGLGGDDVKQSIPREQYPRILFIWGKTRVLPVLIESMSITAQQYDSSLNPIQAEVALTLAVTSNPDDKVGKGALKYSNIAKEAQAIINLANTVELAVDLIPF